MSVPAAIRPIPQINMPSPSSSLPPTLWKELNGALHVDVCLRDWLHGLPSHFISSPTTFPSLSSHEETRCENERDRQENRKRRQAQDKTKQGHLLPLLLIHLPIYRPPGWQIDLPITRFNSRLSLLSHFWYLGTIYWPRQDKTKTISKTDKDKSRKRPVLIYSYTHTSLLSLSDW